LWAARLWEGSTNSLPFREDSAPISRVPLLLFPPREDVDGKDPPFFSSYLRGQFVLPLFSRPKTCKNPLLLPTTGTPFFFFFFPPQNWEEFLYRNFARIQLIRGVGPPPPFFFSRPGKPPYQAGRPPPFAPRMIRRGTWGKTNHLGEENDLLFFFFLMFQQPESVVSGATSFPPPLDDGAEVISFPPPPTLPDKPSPHRGRGPFSLSRDAFFIRHGPPPPLRRQ